jgi:hypothetical protein
MLLLLIERLIGLHQLLVGESESLLTNAAVLL